MSLQSLEIEGEDVIFLCRLSHLDQAKKYGVAVDLLVACFVCLD